MGGVYSRSLARAHDRLQGGSCSFDDTDALARLGRVAAPACVWFIEVNIRRRQQLRGARGLVHASLEETVLCDGLFGPKVHPGQVVGLAVGEAPPRGGLPSALRSHVVNVADVPGAP